MDFASYRNAVYNRLEAQPRPFLKPPPLSAQRPSTHTLTPKKVPILLDYTPLLWDPLPEDEETVRQLAVEEWGKSNASDREWQLLILAMGRHRYDRQYLRDITWHMAEHLFRERDHFWALSHYCLLAHLDLNGRRHPRNPPPGQEQRDGWYYDPAHGFLDATVLKRILEIQKRTGLNLQELQEHYLREAARLHEAPLPLPPDKTWPLLEDALHHYQHLGQQQFLF